MPKAKITSKGQVTIPAKVRRDLGLDVGCYVNFVPADFGYVLKPLVEDSLEGFQKIFSYEGPVVTVEEMNEAIKQAATQSFMESTL